MTAAKIDGTAIARGVREQLHVAILRRQQADAAYQPALRIIQGEPPRPASGPRPRLTGSAQSATGRTRRRTCA